MQYLDRVRKTLNLELGRRSSQLAFLRERASVPCLRQFDSPASVARYLSRGSDGAPRERSLLAAELARLSRTREAELYNRVLTLGFLDALGHLHGRLRRPDRAESATFSTIIERFLAVIDEGEFEGEFAAAELMRRTKHRVFRHLQAERQRASAADVIELREEEIESELPDPEAALFRVDAIKGLRAEVGEVISAERIEDVVALTGPILDEQSLAPWIRENFPSLEEGEWEIAYERLRKRRLRALARIRQQLGTLRALAGEYWAA